MCLQRPPLPAAQVQLLYTTVAYPAPLGSEVISIQNGGAGSN